MNHEVVDNYIKMIKKEISSIYSADEFLSSMREYLDDYCDEHPGCTTEDLEEEFGTPEEIANEFLESKNVSNSGRIKKLRNSRRLIAIIAVVLVVVLIAKIKKLKNSRRLIAIIAVVLVVVLIAVIAFYRDVLSQSTQAKATDVIVIYPEEEVENPVW